jgi:hypothetical protein
MTVAGVIKKQKKGLARSPFFSHSVTVTLYDYLPAGASGAGACSGAGAGAGAVCSAGAGAGAGAVAGASAGAGASSFFWQPTVSARAKTIIKESIKAINLFILYTSFHQ